MRMNWVKAAPWICTFGMFALWELSVWVLDIAPYILPAPSAIAAASYEFGGALWNNSMQTLWTTLAGFAIAVVFGLALGLFISVNWYFVELTMAERSSGTARPAPQPLADARSPDATPSQSSKED